MNYLAHGYRFLHDPYFVAGTSVPDWLNVVDRRVRARAKQAEPIAMASTSARSRIAAGIVRHHWDDRWFHGTRAFQELNMSFAVRIRDLLCDRQGMRPSFLGHILVEILLDATLIERDSGLVDRYYSVLQEIEPVLVETTVNEIAKVSTDRLAWLVGRMREVRFIEDYLDDEKLLGRLNQVMSRVKLPELPAELLAFLPEARHDVRMRQRDLLTPPPEIPPPATDPKSEP